MSNIYVRLPDMTITEVPYELKTLIPLNATIIDINVLKGQRNNSDNSIPGYADISPKGKDPFGLKKPISSSNKKC